MSLFKTLLMLILFTTSLHATPNSILVKWQPNTGLAVVQSKENDSSKPILTSSSFPRRRESTPLKTFIQTRKTITLSKATPALSAQSQSQSELLAITLNDNDNLDDIIETLSEDPNVVYVEPHYPVKIFSTTNDPHLPRQRYLSETNLKHLMTLTKNKTIKIAIVDTGIDYTHEDFQSTTMTNVSFYGYSIGESSDAIDEQSHGTHLASIISADTNNQIGVAGINPNAELLNIRFLDSRGYGLQADAAIAIRYAVDQGADIINCSWGFYKYNTILKEAVDYALANNVLVVAAVGNTNTNIPEYPAAFPGVITVGATYLSGEKTSFSSFGSHLDIMAYGSSMYGAGLSDGYVYKSGSSQSAALVSGILSIIKSTRPELTPTQAKAFLYLSTTSPESKGYKTGYGSISVPKLLGQLSTEDIDYLSEFEEQSAGNGISLDQVLNYPNPIKSTTQFGFNTNKAAATATIDIYNFHGQKIHTLSTITQSGYNRLSWTPTQLPNGTYPYLITLNHPDGTTTKKGLLTILR